MNVICRTRKGVLWTFDLEPKVCKDLGGSYIILRGMGEVGLYTKTMENRLEQLVCDVLPTGFPERYKVMSQHSNRLGYTLARRASFCLPSKNNEIARFLRPDWAPMHELIISAGIEKPRRLHMEELWEMQEKALRLKIDGVPAVYFRADPLIPERIYIGHGEDGGDRGARHGEGLFLVAAVTMGTVADAKRLETDLLHTVRVFCDESDGYYKDGSQGFFVTPKGVGAVDFVLKAIRDHHRSVAKQLILP
jgi:hypothetical protein